MIRVCFVNSGILGHRAVSELLREAAGGMPGVAASHVNLSDDLSIGDRVARFAWSIPLAPRSGPLANLDVRRWRQEWNTGRLAARRLARLDRAGRTFDVLHFHTQAAAYASLPRMTCTPAIVSIDATSRLAGLEASSPLSRWTYGPNIAHDGAVFRAARAIVATSRWAADDLAALYPKCAGKTHVLGYPVRADAFAEDWTPAREARDGRVRVLFMGGDFPRKGGPDLLSAWRAGAFADRAELDLVTDWPLTDGALPAGVRRVGGIAPYTEAWRATWRDADIFAMPTRHEAFGMVFQEAAAAGLPVVATAINAIPEIVEDGTTGLLVPPGDTAALVAALDRLIDDAALRCRLGRTARARMLTAAASSRYAARLGTLIEQVARNHV